MYTSKVHLLHIRRNERTPASVTSLCKAKKAPVLRQAPLLLVRVTGPEARAPGRRLRPLTRLHGRFKSCPKRCAHKAKKAPVLRQVPLQMCQDVSDDKKSPWCIALHTIYTIIRRNLWVLSSVLDAHTRQGGTPCKQGPSPHFNLHCSSKPQRPA